MSDWAAHMEKMLLEAKAVFDGFNLTDAEFYRILYQLGRMRRGEWKEGQI